jgi:O-methyltransferase
VVHIDCDWHDPVKYCLEVAEKKLQIGGFAIVDDYNDYEGAHKAVKDFLARAQGFKILKNSENLVLKRYR